MEMRTVYRYENADGRGPYNTFWLDSVAEQNLMWAHNYDDTHPSWSAVTENDQGEVGEELPKYVRSSSWLSGCKSREALAEWFRGFEESLLANGFTIREYRVPEAAVIDSRSGKQLAFCPVTVV